MNKEYKYIIFMIFFIGLIITVGTYAWLSYRSNDTAMVLTIGEINNVQVTLSPYQIKASLLPQVTYTSDNYVNVTAVNNSSSSRKIRLYYKINNIDNELISNDFKYTILKSTDNGQNYAPISQDGSFKEDPEANDYYITGNFNGTSNGGELTILEENIPNNTTYKYQVYIWIDGRNSGQSYMQGKLFSGELRAEILSHNVTFDATGGIVNISNKVVSYGEQYGDLPIPTKDGYTFKGWNGKNMYNKDSNPYKDSLYLNGLTGEEVSNGEYSIYEMNILPNTSYVITNNGGCTAPGYAIYNSNGDRLSGNRYNNTKIIIFTTPANASYIRFTVITIASKSDKETYQLEEGSVATAYEPYYITNTTTVVQNKDHTLTAIWQEN